MKLLLDENLSPTLVERLAEVGIYALHIAHLGRAGMSDPEIFRYAFAHDLVVATINAADFLTLARGVELHPGLVVLRVAGLSAAEQWAHIQPMVQNHIDADLVNQVIEISGVGRFRRYRLPPE